MQNRTILFLSLPLVALTIIVSSVGLLTPDFYSAETANWKAQCIGQDLIDLFFITPCLLVTSILAFRNNRRATNVWGGIMLYLTYTFVLYCFDVHFNKLFVLYCFCLGLSFYSLIYSIIKQHENVNENFRNKFAFRVVGIYFIVIAAMFYFLWLSEIIPATIQNSIPKSISDAGLFTNGVHVIDLAIVLPAIFITGIFLLKRVSFGFILAPIILTFFILMDITIGTLAVIMKIRGIESDLMVSVIMGALALVSLTLLFWYIRSINLQVTSKK